MNKYRIKTTNSVLKPLSMQFIHMYKPLEDYRDGNIEIVQTSLHTNMSINWISTGSTGLFVDFLHRFFGRPRMWMQKKYIFNKLHTKS